MPTPSNDNSNIEPDLLDLHLGHLSDAQRADLLQRIAADPALASQQEAYSAIFHALGTLSDEAAPAGLARKIQARVAEAGPPPRVTHAPTSDAEPDEFAAGNWIIRVRSLSDIIAVAAVLVLAVGLGLPSLLQVRERSRIMGCSQNLQRLGQGLSAYASAFGDSLPFVGWNKRSSSWQPSNEPGVQLMPNRRHVYPLLRAGRVRAAWFICPSRRDVAMPDDQIGQRNDFIEARNVSYAYQNMAGVRPSLSGNPDLPILADDNPLFDNGLPLFGIGTRLGLMNVAEMNSRAHRGRGQNLLTIGGSVKFADTPYSGVDGDNIWLLKDVAEYKGREGPKSAKDSHLLK